jgi:hypothetical protein
MYLPPIGCGDNDNDKCGKAGCYEAYDIPDCVKEIIERKRTPPDGSIYPIFVIRNTFKGAVVYYFRSACCDWYSYLLDEQCNFICAPDGGFHGVGDGQCPEFVEESTDSEIIWCENKEICDCLEDPAC